MVGKNYFKPSRGRISLSSLQNAVRHFKRHRENYFHTIAVLNSTGTGKTHAATQFCRLNRAVYVGLSHPWLPDPGNLAISSLFVKNLFFELSQQPTLEQKYRYVGKILFAVLEAADDFATVTELCNAQFETGEYFGKLESAWQRIKGRTPRKLRDVFGILGCHHVEFASLSTSSSTSSSSSSSSSTSTLVPETSTAEETTASSHPELIPSSLASAPSSSSQSAPEPLHGEEDTNANDLVLIIDEAMVLDAESVSALRRVSSELPNLVVILMSTSSHLDVMIPAHKPGSKPSSGQQHGNGNFQPRTDYP